MSYAVAARPLTEDAWKPFGWLPVRDTDPRDGATTLQFDWDDAHVNLICHRRDEITYTAEGPKCEMFFRHLTHTQVLLVLNCAAVVAVAPRELSFTEAGDLTQIRAFLLHPQDSLVLHAGTWHWGPFPVDAPQVDLFNVQGLRYADDNDCARLAPLGGPIQVLLER